MKYKALVYSGILLISLITASSQMVKASDTTTAGALTTDTVENNADTTSTTGSTSNENNPTIIASGNLGTTADWTIDSDGLLTIHGGTVDQKYVGLTSNGVDIKQPWGDDYLEKITKIRIVGPKKLVLPKDASGLFWRMNNLTKIEGMENLDTSQVVIAESLFQQCSSLKNLDVTHMDTSKMTDMFQMFNKDTSLESLDLSNFTTDKVTDMSEMFAGDSSLTSLDLSNFYTSKVKNMRLMFEYCSRLEVLNLSKFDMSSLWDDDPYNYASMFYEASNLKELDLSDTNREQIAQLGPLEYSEAKWISVGKGDINNPLPEKSAVGKGASDSNPNDVFEDTSGCTYMVEPDTFYEGSDNVTVNSNLDKNGLVITVPKQMAPRYIGSSLYVDVPKKTGYTNSPTQIKVSATKNGLVADPTSVVYTKDKDTGSSSHHSSGSTQPSKPAKKIMETDQYLTVKSNTNVAPLYNTFETEWTDRALAPSSSWYSNKVMTYDGKTYYQVATDQWVKSSDVYIYQKSDTIVRTRDKEITYLKNISDKEVTNRGLAANTDWKADQLVNINGQDYYRVATNEFVNAKDVDLIYSK